MYSLHAGSNLHNYVTLEGPCMLTLYREESVCKCSKSLNDMLTSKKCIFTLYIIIHLGVKRINILILEQKYVEPRNVNVKSTYGVSNCQ